MNHDISQSVSQGSNGAQDEKNSRIAAIANELERLCSIHEAQFGNSQQNVSRLDAEQRAAEQMAKSQGYWIPMMDVFNLGVPGPSGNENDTYVGEKVIYKVNNLLICGENAQQFQCFIQSIRIKIDKRIIKNQEWLFVFEQGIHQSQTHTEVDHIAITCTVSFCNMC